MLLWIRSLFAWREVLDTGVWLYKENAITGARKAQRTGLGHQPKNHLWLAGVVDDVHKDRQSLVNAFVRKHHADKMESR